MTTKEFNEAMLAADLAKLNAESAKLHAEAAKFLSEARNADMNAALNQELIRHAAAETRKAAALAGEQELLLLNSQRNERDYQAGNWQNRVFMFSGIVDGNSTKACINALTMWSRLYPGCDIEIVFNSLGGSVIEGMALFDYIHSLRSKGHHITTGCYGMAASMGAILLQAGDVRYIGSQSYLLLHEVSSGISGKIGEIKDELKLLEKMTERILDIFFNRSSGTLAEKKMTRDQLRTALERTDLWVTSEEALAMGLVDEIR